jgi:hypothetical protein
MDSSKVPNYGMMNSNSKIQRVYFKQLGFIPNPHDPCVFNKDFNGKQCTLVLYVDDCFVDCEPSAALDYVEQKIIERYGGCTRHDGDVLPFLGVMMDFTEKGVVIFTMPALVDEIVRNVEVATIADTPARNNLFILKRLPKAVERGKRSLSQRYSEIIIRGKKYENGHLIAGKLPVQEGAGAYRR